MAKPQIKILDSKVQASNGDQSVHMKVLASLGDHKLQFRLRSNAYKAQGYAVVERFDGAQWQNVSRIVPDAMATREGLIYRVKCPVNANAPEGVSTFDFSADFTELKRQAMLILA